VRFFNTFTRRKEEFVPLEAGKVRMYTCGPTVYDYAHIGNYRTYMFEDLLRRYLKYRGYQVTQVMNITDVDDKTIRNSRERGIPLNEYTEKYTQSFFEDLDTLGIERAEHYPKATDCVPEMIAIIQDLVKKGYGYKSEDGSVYYNIAKFPNYGKLAHINVDELQSGARVSQDEYDKEAAADFALWKAWSDEDGEVAWDSPFGKGRPGWHIECSAMSMKHLGPTLDIHTGGVDNIFPHHEDEIAQSEAHTGKKFVRYWLHSEHLIVENRKMSKSLGNFFTLRDLIEKGYDGPQIRYLLISSHYRQQLNFTFQGLDAARASLNRLRDFMIRLEEIESEGVNDQLPLLIENTRQRFEESLDDDLNAAGALGSIFEMVHEINRMIEAGSVSKQDAGKVIDFMRSIDAVLGILPKTGAEEEIDPEAVKLAEQRDQARKAKDWALADELRDKITAMGYVIEDTPHGPRVKRK